MTSAITKCLSVVAYLAILAATAPANPSAVAARLKWNDLTILLYPDSADGTLFWITDAPRDDDAGTHSRFGAFFDPDSAGRWIARAREFNNRQLADGDTAQIVTSATLTSTAGDRLYLVRRRLNGHWSNERLVGIRTHEGTSAQYIAILNDDARTFFDSLASVVLRTPLLDSSVGSKASIFYNPADSTSCILPDRRDKPPAYPVVERQRGTQGSAWMIFVVTPQGRIDMKTVAVVFADSPGFASAARDALAVFRFEPEQKNGVPIAARATMQFAFAMRDPNSTNSNGAATAQAQSRDKRCR